MEADPEIRTPRIHSPSEGLRTMHINRGLLFWGLALITAGATALAVIQGYVDRDFVAEVWRLWPLILIAIGLSIVLARTPYAVIGTVLAALVLGVGVGSLVGAGPSVACTGAVPSDLETSSGEFVGDTASVNLQMNCGELNIAMADGSAWTAGTATTGDRDVEVIGTDSTLTMRTTGDEGWNFDGGKLRWDLGLGSDVTYDLQVSANAADAEIDLSGGTFSDVDVDPNAASLFFDLSGATFESFGISMNAGSAEIQTDAGTTMDGTLAMNAGSMELCTAPDAALRITVNANVTFSHNLDSTDLTQSGDTWTSASFDGASTFIDLRLEGNAASFTLNPDGGCS
jgi:Domain of unknown function (DUF5668)